CRPSAARLPHRRLHRRPRRTHARRSGAGGGWVGAPRLRRPVALTVAGSDSGGGAGIEADLKTFEAHGVWGTAAVTAVTAQNSLGVQTSEGVSPEVVRAQMASVAADIGVDAAKTGMLVDAPTVTTVAETVHRLGIAPLV